MFEFNARLNHLSNARNNSERRNGPITFCAMTTAAHTDKILVLILYSMSPMKIIYCGPSICDK